MENETKIMGKPGTLFWVLAGLFLLWNAFGCGAYLMDTTMSDAAYAETYGESMLAIRDKFPTWTIAAYALAVWIGLLASILLLLRKKWAAPLFVISLIAAVISFTWSLTNAEARAAAGSSVWVMPVIVVVAGVIEVIWSRKKVADGTLT